MTDLDELNEQRHLEKIELALTSAKIYFERTSEANAALHGSDKVLYSPITIFLSQALESVSELRKTRSKDA